MSTRKNIIYFQVILLKFSQIHVYNFLLKNWFFELYIKTIRYDLWWRIYANANV